MKGWIAYHTSARAEGSAYPVARFVSSRCSATPSAICSRSPIVRAGCAQYVSPSIMAARRIRLRQDRPEDADADDVLPDLFASRMASLQEILVSPVAVPPSLDE